MPLGASSSYGDISLLRLGAFTIMDNKETQSPQPQIEEEIWKTHSSGYEVSSFGRVRGKNVEFLKPSTDQDGYLVYRLNINNKGFSKAAHRLVGETFLGKIADNEVVNHKDGDKSNPKLSNLEIVTESENSIHAHRTGLAVPIAGESHHNSIFTEEDIRNIYELLKSGLKPSQIALKYGVQKNCIQKIQRGETWKNLFIKYNMEWISRKRPIYKINEEIIRKVISLHKDGKSKSSISVETGLPIGRVNSLIKNGIVKSVKLLNKKLNFSKLSVSSLDGEVWKLHRKTNRYVSNLGRVVGFFGNILKPLPDGQGYTRVRLNSRNWRIHILVWEAFSGQTKPKGMEINHLDRNKENNKLDNLELVTPSQNSKHCCLTKNISKGSKCGRSKLTEKDIPRIREKIRNGETYASVAIDYNIHPASIRAIALNLTWKHI